MLAPRRGNQQAVRLLRGRLDRGDRAPPTRRTYLERALAEPPTSDARPELLPSLGRLGTLTDGPAAIVYLRTPTRPPWTRPGGPRSPPCWLAPSCAPGSSRVSTSSIAS
jgi:hypothetical protein